jgi:hypothetical protein
MLPVTRHQSCTKAQIMAKLQPLVAPGGRFARDRFVIVADEATVSGPA